MICAVLMLGCIPAKLIVILGLGAVVMVYKMVPTLFLRVNPSGPGRTLRREEASISRLELRPTGWPHPSRETPRAGPTLSGPRCDLFPQAVPHRKEGYGSAPAVPGVPLCALWSLRFLAGDDRQNPHVIS